MQQERENLGYLIHKAAQVLRWDLSAKLEAHGLTITQWSVLRDIASREEEGASPMHRMPASIAERLGADRPTISGVIGRLKEKGYIEVKPNPADGRSQLVFLSETGQRMIPILDGLSRKTMVKAIQGWPEQDHMLLKRLLLRLIDSFQEAE